MHAYVIDALMTSDVKGLGILLEAGLPINCTLVIGQHSGTLLSHAVLNAASCDFVEALLEKGADVLSPAPEGITLLHVAGATGDLRLAKLLVRYGADVEATLPGTAITPSTMALSNDKLDLVEFFSTVTLSTDNRKTSKGSEEARLRDDIMVLDKDTKVPIDALSPSPNPNPVI